MASSSSFDILQIQERLDENLSGDQLANTLDDFIFKALRPIIMYTNHVEQSLVEMLPFVASNARRKFSNKTQAELVDLLFSVVVSRNKKTKLKTLRALHLERTVYFGVFASFESLVRQHAEAEMQYINTPRSDKPTRYAALRKLRLIEQQLGLKPGRSLGSVAAKATFWCDVALSFKGMIVEKFVRLAYMDSGKAVAQTALNIDRLDLFKDFIVSIAKAIDKYNPEKGTPTSYIRWWFLDAKTPSQNRHEYGVAYSMPTAQRKRMLADGTLSVNNLSESIDSDKASGVHDTTTDLLSRMIETEEPERVGNLAARADPHRLAALVHDIPYRLSADEANLLRETRTPKMHDLVKNKRATGAIRPTA